MDLLELYTAIVESAGWNVNSEGFVTAFKGPVEIAGKQMVMPTKKILRNPDWDNHIAFHPMSENVMRGESAVLFELRNQMQFKLNFVAATLIQGLGELAADPARQKPLTIKQKEYLKLVPDFDAKTVKSLDSLLDRINPAEAEKIIGLFVKRSGEMGDKKYNRLATVHSPLRMEASNKDRTIFGVKFRKSDFKPFFDMFDFILPDINEHAYSFGSNSMVAPSFHALLHAYIATAKRLNVVLRKFQKVWGEDFDDLLIDVSWEDDVKELDPYKGLIPNLRGNEGAVDPNEVEEVEPPTPAMPAAPAGKSKKLDWSAKQEQVLEEGRKMTLTEKLAQSAPKPATSFAQKPAQEAPAETAPTKRRFQDMVNPQQNNPQHTRQSTPYSQPQTFGNTGGPGWAQPQQQNTGWGGQPQQPMQQSTPYPTGNQFGNQGNWGNRGW